jgi:hypothetical protein
MLNLNRSDGKEAKLFMKQTANYIDQTKRWSSPNMSFLRRHPVGDQLRRDVQHWLSPPDPSTNHNFVRKARHCGTAAWFFKSSLLTEWKTRGSLLWIHGKRMFFEPSTSALHYSLVDFEAGAGKSTLLYVMTYGYA